MRELQRIWENVHLAVKKDFDSPHLPLHPTPSSPQCPPARELRDACLGLDLLCFKFPGNLALALSRGRVFPASQAPGLCHGGQTDGTPPTLWPVPAESNVQPPRAKLPARSLTGGQPAALHPLTANLSLHGPGTPTHRAGGGQRDMCFTHPRGMQALAWCSGQETGRLVQLPVPLKRRHQLQQVCGDTLRGLRPPGSTCLRAGFSSGAGTVSDGCPVAHPPLALVQRPRDEFTWSLPLACPCSSLLPHSRRMLLPSSTAAFPQPPAAAAAHLPGATGRCTHRCFPTTPHSPSWAAASEGWAHALGGVGVSKIGWGQCVRAVSSPKCSLQRDCCRAGGVNRG